MKKLSLQDSICIELLGNRTTENAISFNTNTDVFLYITQIYNNHKIECYSEDRNIF